MANNYRFYFKHSSPTFYNLAKYLQQQGWQATRFSWRAHFGEKNLQFNQAVAETLEFKHLLAQLVNHYCPHATPETYVINDTNWPTILTEIAGKTEATWILKPSLLNNGQHIHIFTEPNQLEHYFLQTDRLGGEHVLQRYITNPHLLREHKYTTRLFVILSSASGAYLYPYGYCNVAQHPYTDANYSDLSPHLTNEHLTADAANVIQIPTARFDFFPAVYQQMHTLLSCVMQALQQDYPHVFNATHPHHLAIFGFDFINDADGRVWLLEANHGPCFPIDEAHPLQNYLYTDFWQALVKDFVLPIAKQESIVNSDSLAFQKI